MRAGRRFYWADWVLTVSATTVFALAFSSSAAWAQVASFISLGDLPGSIVGSNASAVSSDGSVVVGAGSTASGSEAFIWDAVAGMRGLGDLPGGITSSQSVDVSADGLTIVGYGNTTAGQRAFIWDSINGMRALGEMSGFEGLRSGASGVSGDGSRVVGSVFELFESHAYLWTSLGGMQPISGLPVAGRTGTLDISEEGSTIIGHAPFTSSILLPFIWDATNGMRGLPTLSGDGHLDRPAAVSVDGRFVVGAAESPEGTQAFLWDAVSGIRGLGELPGGPYFSEARAVSADASVIVGHSWTEELPEAFIWSPELGMNSLEVVLSARRIDLTGWKLETAEDMSSDGRTIVGMAIDPQGQQVAYVAFVPEPEAFVLISAGVALIAGVDARRRMNFNRRR